MGEQPGFTIARNIFLEIIILAKIITADQEVRYSGSSPWVLEK